MDKRKSIVSCMMVELGIIFLYGAAWEIGIKAHIHQGSMGVFGRVYLLLLFLSMALLLIFVLCRYSVLAIRPEIRFFLLLTILGIMYNLVLPALSAPDEDTHFASAYRLSNIMLGQADVDDRGNTVMRREDVKNQIYTYGEKEYVAYYEKLFSLQSDGEEQMVSFTKRTPETTVPITTYLAPALGITVARLLNLSYGLTTWAGRLCCLLLCALLSAMSYRLLPFMRQSVMVLCTLPMTLSLSSSMSYDGINLGLILLFFAVVMQCAYVIEKISWKEIAILMILAFCLAPIKIVYIPFLWLICLIPLKKFPNRTAGIISYGSITILPVLESIWLKSQKISFIAKGTTNLTAEEGYTISYVLRHPLETMRFILYSVIFKKGDEMVEGLAGRHLGWLDTKIPRYLAYAFLFLLFLYIITEKVPILLCKWQKIIIAVSAFCQLSLPVLVMFLAETKLTDNTIACVQGRYFLPVILLFPILFANNRFVRADKENDTHLECLIVYLNSISVIMVLHSILNR